MTRSGMLLLAVLGLAATMMWDTVAPLAASSQAPSAAMVGRPSSDAGQAAPAFKGISGLVRIIRETAPDAVGPGERPPLVSASAALEAALRLSLDGTGVFAVDGVVSGVTWRRTGDHTVAIDAGRLHASGEHISWSGIAFTLADADGDGVMDTGQASCVCSWRAFSGDVTASGEARYRFALRPDADGPRASLAPAGRWEGVAPLPTDALVATFSAPVPALKALAALRLTADGREVPGRFDARSSDHVQAAAFTFTPSAPLPHGAALAVVVDGVTDLAGRAAGMGRTMPRVVADPGPLTLNGSFEHGLRGWSTRGDVRVTGGDDLVAPADGAAHAHVTDGMLLGYMDVPTSATRLELTVTFAAAPAAAPDATAWLWMITADGRRTPLDPPARRAPGTPVRLAVNLRPYRGQRLYLEAEALDAVFLTGKPSARLVVDHVAVR